VTEFARGLLEDQGRQAVLALLGLLMTAAVWYPLQNRRPPHALALGGSALALLLPQWIPSAHALSSALPGAAGAIAGLLVAGTAFLPLYLTGASTASDVKLMAMVGAFLGPIEVAGAILFTLLAGSLLSVLCSVRARAELPAVPCAVAIALGTAAWIVVGTTRIVPGQLAAL
jgi:Flp pilus assembly protein protease CpaA